MSGLYGEGIVYVINSIEDFDEYAKVTNKSKEKIDKLKERFNKYIGKIWQDFNKPLDIVDGVQQYMEYKIIGLEDNIPYRDYYWVVQNVDDERDIQYVLNIRTGLKEVVD